MTSIRKTCVQLGLALLALGSSATLAAQALPQQRYSPVAEDPGEALSRNLTALATDPQSVGALSGAGRAALQLGDYQAALNFFARAEELAPRDGRIKAGIGSSLVMMEQGRTALKFFADALALGMPAAEIAGDRGLAYDLAGDPRQAQADYRLALARAENPEVRRRLALSLAISGDRHEALATIDAQVRQQDRAAWRTRAFVLALTGDTAGATQAVQAVMPAQAAALHPFLVRLPTLSVSDRALAVHFGRFPGDPAMVQAPSAAAPAVPAGTGDPTRAGQPDPAPPSLGTTVGATVPLQQPASQLSSVNLAQSNVATAPAAPPISTPVQQQPRATGPPPLPADASQLRTQPIPATPPASSLTPSSPLLGQSAAERPATLSSAIPPDLVNSEEVVLSSTATAAPQAAPPSTAPPLQPQPTDITTATFADVAELIAALPVNDAATSPPPQPSAANSNKAATPARPVASTATAKPATQAARPARAKPPAKPREPSRIWVQIAGGANEAALPREFTRLKAKAPKLFAGRTAWTTTLRATNRLLVGPFKTNKEAQAFVNQLTAANLAGFAWTSAEGQEIKKLAVK